MHALDNFAGPIVSTEAEGAEFVLLYALFTILPLTLVAAYTFIYRFQKLSVFNKINYWTVILSALFIFVSAGAGALFASDKMLSDTQAEETFVGNITWHAVLGSLVVFVAAYALLILIGTLKFIRTAINKYRRL